MHMYFEMAASEENYLHAVLTSDFI